MQNADLTEKVEHYILQKKLYKNWKENNYKIWGNCVWKKMINQYERPIPIKNKDTNKMIVSNEV